MKKLSLLFTAICLATSLFSQKIKVKRSSVTYFEGVERTLYWGRWAPHFGLEYALYFDKRFSSCLGFGRTALSTNALAGHGAETHLKLWEPQVNFLIAVVGNHRRNSLRLGFGWRHIIGKVVYPETFNVRNGRAVDVKFKTRQIKATSLNLLLQNDFRVVKNIFVGIQLDVNPFAIREDARKAGVFLFTTNSIASSSFSATFTTPDPQPLGHALLRVGWRF